MNKIVKSSLFVLLTLSIVPAYAATETTTDTGSKAAVSQEQKPVMKHMMKHKASVRTCHVRHHRMVKHHYTSCHTRSYFHRTACSTCNSCQPKVSSCNRCASCSTCVPKCKTCANNTFYHRGCSVTNTFYRSSCGCR
jgi:hypothetical protein